MCDSIAEWIESHPDDFKEVNLQQTTLQFLDQVMRKDMEKLAQQLIDTMKKQVGALLCMC